MEEMGVGWKAYGGEVRSLGVLVNAEGSDAE